MIIIYRLQISKFTYYIILFSVSCAPGSFYDSGTAKCTQCPIGQYQSLTGQLSCVSCPSGQTTYNTGTQANTLCFGKCNIHIYYYSEKN